MKRLSAWIRAVSPGASLWTHRVVVTAVVLGSAWVAWDTFLHLSLLPEGLERRFVIGPLNLIFAGYAAVLALFVAWKVGHRRDGRHLALLLVYIAACMALSVVPTGDTELWRRIAFGAFWMGAIVEGFKFWTTFPRAVTRQGVRGLLDRVPRTGFIPMVDRVTARCTAALVGTTWAKVAFTGAALGFAYRLVGPGTHRYNILSDPTPLTAHSLPEQVVLDLLGASVILIIVGVAWTGFRLASEAERQRVLWIIFAQLTVAFFTVTSTVLGLLSDLTGSGTMGGLAGLFGAAYHPLVWFIDLSGFAVAIFYSGAFDLRPIINKTTIYGGLFITLTFLFAAVEEIAQNLLTQRLDLPNGVGTWLGAASIAVAMGPVRGRLEKLIKGFSDALEKDLEG